MTVLRWMYGISSIFMIDQRQEIMSLHCPGCRVRSLICLSHAQEDVRIRLSWQPTFDMAEKELVA